MGKSKKLAILGANGYLGQHTIRAAIKEGWEVIGIIRREEVIAEVKDLGARPFIVKNLEPELLKEAFEGCISVIHFANVVCGSEELFRKINVEGTQAILEAAKEEKVSRIIYPSGLGTDYYSKVDWATNEYFHSKFLAERAIIESGLSYVIFRPSYILGPKDELIPEILDQIWDSKVLVVGEGKIPMQPIYVKDAVSAFVAAAEGKGENNRIYDLVGPKVITMLELNEMIFTELTKLGINLPPPSIEHIPLSEAAERTGLCQEMIDVMQCDLIRDGTIVANALGFELSALDTAIKAAIIKKLSLDKKQSQNCALILLSGGIDSATALYWAIREGYKIIALSIDYKYRPEKEKIAAQTLAEKLGIKLIEIELPFYESALDLRFEGHPIPSLINAPQGYMPQRNLIFYSIAAYYAEMHGIENIIGGHIKKDAESYTDASENFFKDLESMIRLGIPSLKFDKIRILLPLMSMNKAEVLKLAKEMKVPIELTWSCHLDGEKPCGRCKSCLDL